MLCRSYLIIFFYCISYVNSRPWHYMKDRIPSSDKLDPEDTKSLCTVNPEERHFIIRRLMTWPEALEACQSFCSSLAYIAGKDEALKIGKVLSELEFSSPTIPPDFFLERNKYEFPRDRRYWIGLNDLGTEGLWSWTRTSMKLYYDNWYPNQPDHQRNKGKNTTGGSEHCVTLWNPVFYKEGEIHTFNDEPCTMKYYAICNGVDLEAVKNEQEDFEEGSRCVLPKMDGCS